MSFGINLGTGRAYCRFCRKPILKGQICIKVSGYQLSGQVHYNPEDCEYLRRRLEELQ